MRAMFYSNHNLLSIVIPSVPGASIAMRVRRHDPGAADVRVLGRNAVVLKCTQDQPADSE
jgi:hypothetical protein